LNARVHGGGFAMEEQREEATMSRETKGGRTDIVALLRGTLSITKVSYNI